jgi:glucosamine-6-phosphate deaminase
VELVGVRKHAVDRLQVEVHPSKDELGAAAARRAADRVRQAIADRGRARLIIGTGPSQNEVIASFMASEIDWPRVEAFHMDEYVGISAGHPASFRHWLRERVANAAPLRAVHYLEGDASDVERECLRYAELLAEAPIDVCFIGFGENGHIAFNDPHVADFADPVAVKQVEMDRQCRAQQVGEGHFPSMDDVPRHALTLTCPTLFAARTLVCSVPDRRKAEAVRAALHGPVATACPASIVRTHPDAALFLEPGSASLLGSASGRLERAD